MNEQQREEWQERVSDLADEILDEAIANGEAFTEGLCNWAMNRALEQVR